MQSMPDMKLNDLQQDSFYSDQVISKKLLMNSSAINMREHELEEVPSASQSKSRVYKKISHKLTSSRQSSIKAMADRGSTLIESRNSLRENNLISVEDIELVDQSRYTGTMLRANNGYEVVKHGFGVQVWKDGAMYEGEWRNGKANGQGKFSHTNGDIYDGEFKEDRAYGQGIYYHKNGSKYIGSWKDDLKDGFGREEWEDGSYYEGHFKAGAKHGQGTYKWADGSSYEGVWVNNNIEGHGRYEWPDGRIYEGSWKENKLHGKGVYSWGDGRKYDGFYVEDKKQGFGTYYWPDGRQYQGFWHNGKQHGEGKFYNSKGKCKEGLWEKGVRIRWISENQEEEGKQRNDTSLDRMTSLTGK